MTPALPVALFLLALLPTLAKAQTPGTNAAEAAAASLKAAQAETTRLEALHRSLSVWKTEARAVALALQDMNKDAMQLAMAATEDEARWQQALNGWRGDAYAQALAEQTAKLRRPTPDAGDTELVATSASLRERLDQARKAVTDFNKAGLSVKPEQPGRMLDHCQSLLNALSGAAQAGDALADQLDTRLTRLDTRLLLLRSQTAALDQPAIPLPQVKKP